VSRATLRGLSRGGLLRRDEKGSRSFPFANDQRRRDRIHSITSIHSPGRSEARSADHRLGACLRHAGRLHGAEPQSRLDAGDPLHRAGRCPELSRDLVKAGTVRSRQSVTDSLFRLGCHSGPPEGFPALGAARLGHATAPGAIGLSAEAKIKRLDRRGRERSPLGGWSPWERHRPLGG
jgi:hypothetical protein